MKKMILSVCLMLACAGVLKAHNLQYDHVNLRRWSVVKQHRTVDGSFYLYKDGKVFIEDAHQKVVSYPLWYFSQADQAYVRKIQERIDKINSTMVPVSAAEPAQAAGVAADFNSIPWLATLAVLALGGGACFILDRRRRQYAIVALGGGAMIALTGFTVQGVRHISSVTNPAYIDSAFAPFKPKVNTWWDAKYFYVESKGIPDHEMMTGITNWQQQVPIPQCYIGNNAWSIPLNPVIAVAPVPVNPQHFLRGAIAIAVNGIAIFNPYTNTGVDALADGQLDKFGGHCGRADDYHYHIAPLSLYSQTSATLPIAFALDGFAVYGSVEPDGTPMQALDENHGHYGTNGVYHYHGTQAAPYMVGRMVGQVTEDSTLQIIPQARANPVRPAGTPLRGASITSCTPNSNKNGYSLTYTLSGVTYHLNYEWSQSGVYTFELVPPTGSSTKNTYNGFVQCNVPLSVTQPDPVQEWLLMYPNPVRGTLYLQSAGPVQEKDVKEIRIVNNRGAVVYRAKGYRSAIDLTGFAAGVYVVTVQCTKSQAVRKIIVQ